MRDIFEPLACDPQRVQDPLERTRIPYSDAGLRYATARDGMMDKALQAFGGQVGALPTYADFYKHIDSVFQCIWAAQESRERRIGEASVWEHLAHAEKALQALDDYIYAQLGKGDI